MELFAISGLVNAIASISFGVLVIWKNWRSKENQVFFLMTATLAIWGISYWRWLQSADYETAILWVRLLAVGSVFIPTFFFDWVGLLLKRGKRVRNLVSISYIAAILVALFANTEYVIHSLERKLFFSFWPNPGLFYTVYFWILYVGVILYAVHTLYHCYLEEKDPHSKGRLLYVLWGAILGFGGGFTNFLLWYGIQIPPYGNFLVAAFPFLLGFSVVRHGLFNAKTIATEILVFFIGVILFIQLILSNSPLEYLLRGAFFVLVIFFGILLIRSVYREVEQRERIEKLAKELEKANERLKELDQLKSEFVSLATHQIRGPLTAIKGYASMMRDGDYGEVPARIKGTVDIIFESSNALTTVVQDFLDISRIEQGRMQYDFSVFNLSELTYSVAELLTPNVERKKLLIKLEIEPNIVVEADAGKMRQIIGNLIDNAVKYTSRGHIIVSLKKLGTVARLSVKDTGVGIKPETTSKLFQKFSRAEDANKANILGTGLGLYVAKKLLEAQKGRIFAESEGEEKGSTFFVELNTV